MADLTFITHELDRLERDLTAGRITYADYLAFRRVLLCELAEVTGERSDVVGINLARGVN